MPSSNPKSPVRVATPADADAVFDLLLASHADNGVFSIDEQRVRERIDVLTRHPKGGQMGLIGVIDAPDGSRLAGAVILMLEQYWYSSEWYLSEYVNFVRPEYRRSHYARDLIDFAKATADQFGVPLGMAIISTKRTAAKVRLYSRLLKHTGGTFVHGLERANGPLAIEARI